MTCICWLWCMWFMNFRAFLDDNHRLNRELGVANWIQIWCHVWAQTNILQHYWEMTLTSWLCLSGTPTSDNAHSILIISKSHLIPKSIKWLYKVLHVKCAEFKIAAWNTVSSIWHNFEVSAKICHMNMSQHCNFMALVSLQQDKLQHMIHFLYFLQFSELFQNVISQNLYLMDKTVPCKMHTIWQWNAKSMSVSCATHMRGEAKVLRTFWDRKRTKERLPNAPRLHWVSLALTVSAGSRRGWISENCPTLLEELQVCTFLHYKRARCYWFYKNNMHWSWIICKSANPHYINILFVLYCCTKLVVRLMSARYYRRRWTFI